MRSPVLFLVFNRPETTRQVFAALREARPSRLYVAADGPRSHKEGEAELCAETRAVATAVDWPCEVKTLFRARNLGCGKAVSSAITWFFQNEPEGIILEDDVLPHQDFFRYCDTLLEKYRDEERVMHISGDNFQLGLKRGEASVYFSHYAHVWGWASWARAWAHYDLAMPGLRQYLRSDMPGLIGTPAARHMFRHGLESTARGELNTWDFPWNYTTLRLGGLCAMPNAPLVRNIGFGSGTHCQIPDLWACVEPRPMPDIVLPSRLEVDEEADMLTSRLCHEPFGTSLPKLLEEGCRRLETGQAYANPELIRMIREFYGDSFLVEQLDVLTALCNEGPAAALRKAVTLAAAYPAEEKVGDLIQTIKRALSRQAA